MAKTGLGKNTGFVNAIFTKVGGDFLFHRLAFFLCSVLCYPSGSVDVCVSMMQNFISQTDGTVTADAMEYVKVTPAVV